MIAPMESTLPVAVTQLPTAMSERLPVLVLLIGVELLKATFTFPSAVLRMSVEPLTLTSTPPVRSPSRNPVEAVPPTRRRCRRRPWRAPAQPWMRSAGAEGGAGRRGGRHHPGRWRIA